MSKDRICAIFGENPNELAFGYDEEYYTCAAMKYRLVAAMQEAIAKGTDTFITTLDEGAAMWGAEACTAIKEFGGGIRFIAAPTAEEQAERWHPERRERYFNLLEAADEVITPAGSSYGEDYILKNADSLIMLGNYAHPRLSEIITKAEAFGIEIKVV